MVTAFGRIPALEPDQPLAAGGETWRQYLSRSTHALARILAEHRNERILVVGHGETIDATFHLFLGVPAEQRPTAIVTAYYAALTTWAEQPLSWTRPDAGWRWALTAHNDTRHLIITQDALIAVTCRQYPEPGR